jgi:tRNA N6-adenosine threonylcarbamoyltransferase
MSQPTILSIDTSCDETSVAISSGRNILSNVVSSQVNIHKKWGGVVPHLAKRAHLDKIEPVTKEAILQGRKQINFGTLSAIAVTVGPGLAPALEVGIAFAKKLSLKHQKPLIAINHMEGHLLSSLALNSKGKHPSHKGSEPLCSFPAIGLLVSGGHTQLVLVKKIGQYQLLGQTLDDAAGEALDKLAKMLKLGYPGGPIIEILAKKGDPKAIELPVPMQHSKDLNFSFSGLKTAAMYQIKAVGTVPTVKYTQDMAASFQQAVATSLTTKLKKAINQYSPKAILLGGGVFSNLYIRNQVRSSVKSFNLPLHLPYSKKLFTDNAAMICIPAYYKYLKKDFVKNINKLDRQPNLGFRTSV